MNLLNKLESILFVASGSLSIKKLATILNKNENEAEEAVSNLKLKYNQENSGIWIFVVEDEIRMGTNPANAEVIEGLIKNEVTGELTKAQLETLTVVAYRGPITRPELEQIRGVNCAIILRNLIIRGLVEEKDSTEKLMSAYSVTLDALAHLGIASITDLPEYEGLSKHENVEAVVGSGENSGED